MNEDIKENISKIIDAKLKQIKTQAEFYETKIRTERSGRENPAIKCCS